jgi:hypothetical protein
MGREFPLPPKVDTLGAENREEKGSVPEGLRAGNSIMASLPDIDNP